MSNSRIKQIKRIIANADVRDPRATLIAIEDVLSQEKPKKPVPALMFIAERINESRMGVTIKSDKSLTEPEMCGLIDTMRKHREVVFGSPDAQVMPLHELFAALEADLVKAAGVKEGGAK
jgi:hypothetical protein